MSFGMAIVSAAYLNHGSYLDTVFRALICISGIVCRNRCPLLPPEAARARRYSRRASQVRSRALGKLRTQRPSAVHARPRRGQRSSQPRLPSCTAHPVPHTIQPQAWRPGLASGLYGHPLALAFC